MKNVVTTALFAAISFCASAQTDSVGKMSLAEFQAVNAKGNQMVSAVTPTKTAMSEADKQLFLKVAAGGQRQLALSQAVVGKATDPQVATLAASEVEEQTGVSAKLKEIAAAKGITLSEGPDAATKALVARASNLNGAALDQFYLEYSGIRGHQLLQSTMFLVSARAKDASLKSLAAATLPVIRTHLAVSKQVKARLGAKK